MRMFLLIILGLALLFAVVLFVQNKKPSIELGLEEGRLREIPDKDNAVSTETKIENKRIEPLSFKSTLEKTKEAMKKSLSSYGNIKIKEEKRNYIYAVDTTGKMKFHDDIEIYFDEKNKKIQYRSASRSGYSDMGVNKKRYKEISKVYTN
ncbi:DUF1499 domain-containing protein [Clostridium oceanicum]|uniref:DUF1499 domain-containing protein n=1 Tax=Clostridium oceanicum TaxID=1543 RepID=A0ABN1JLW9_9CLOT